MSPHTTKFSGQKKLTAAQRSFRDKRGEKGLGQPLCSSKLAVICCLLCRFIGPQFREGIVSMAGPILPHTLFTFTFWPCNGHGAPQKTEKTMTNGMRSS